MSEVTESTMGGQCTRCHGNWPGQKVFFIRSNPALSFVQPKPEEMPDRIDYEVACATCLTDSEVAKFLTPIALFVLDEMLKVASGDLIRTLAPARSYLFYRGSPLDTGRTRDLARKMLEESAR